MTAFLVPGTGGKEQEQNNAPRSRNVPGTTSGTFGPVPDLVPVPVPLSQERGTEITAAIGCADCQAEIQLTETQPQIFNATIRHDATCPAIQGRLHHDG